MLPGRMRNKVIGWLVLALVVYYISTDPVGAGHTGKSVLAGAGTAAGGLITFLSTLTH